ncbi:MAG: FtsQ-type POTRA domain-containing protein [Oscillospiraceae bacterium]|nr:FtsQ-type POTRA domain-containing protein [Oscillospiraceae bacterium]
MLTFLVICGAIVAALALFFKVETIEVTGAERYSQQEIVDACGIQTGSNLFLMDKYDAAGRITSRLNYVEQVQITRRLPSTLCIHVTECKATVAIEHDGTFFLISGSGKIVDTASEASGCGIVTGVTIFQPQVGAVIDAPEENRPARDQLLELLKALRDREMLADVQEIHLEDPSAVTMGYLDRFTVTLPWGADMEYKMNYLMAVVERLEDNERGIINMMQDQKVNFIPR